MTSVVVIGGGIIGTAVANWLISDGFDVSVLERDPDGRPASTGNAGILSLPEITPLARPGILTSVPGWLMDPLGPLSLRARDLPALTPWLARFALAARPSQVAHATTALAFLMKTALGDHIELARRAGVETYMRRTGALYLYDTDASLRSALGEWKERAQHGVDYQILEPEAARALVPAVKGPFAKALLAPDSWTVTNPLTVLQGLRRSVMMRGKFLAGDVRTIVSRGDKVEVATADELTRQFDYAVVAGGVWSRDLVRAMGLSVALETERGYNTTFAKPGFALEMPVFFSDHGFVATPLVDGIRVGGAVELADVDAPPNFARAAAMRKKMRRYVPELPEEGGTEWMGCRPSTPDSLPVIGKSPKDPRVVFAFGHGHLGLTLSAVTARQVAALVSGHPTERALDAFGIGRFQ